MARRRTSPLPSRARNASDSEDDGSDSSEGSFFLEDEDPQNLYEQPPTIWSKLRSVLQSDPHAPRAIPLSRRQARRQRRQERQTRRKARRRGADDAAESSTLYDASDATEAYKDDKDDPWSDEEYHPRREPSSRRSGSQRCTRLAIFGLIAGMVIILAVLFFVPSPSSMEDGAQRAPIARPSSLCNNGTSNFGPTTILISLDGFRGDFLDLGITPVLSSFRSAGVSPLYMKPSFPSVTFPNHWTLVTGLHPESHGVVGNSFWDDDLGEEFYYTDPAKSMFPKWWTSTGAQPLWETAERQGIRSAVHMWPGSEAGLQPEPFYIDKYNGNEKLSTKVDHVLAWLDLESPFDTPGVEVDQSLSSPRPQFISMYVPDVDSDGHLFGPNTTEIHNTIRHVDSMLGELFHGLETRNLTDIVNVVVVSDHGMASTSRERLVQFEDIVDPNDIEHIHGWPLYGLRPKAHVNLEKLSSDIKAKQSALADSPGWSAYTLDTMPERWHFNSNPRIAPLFLIPDAGWSIVTKDEMDLSDPSNDNAVYHPKGIHGYDNDHPLMRAIFVARGPSFPHPPGSRISPFQNTEVYGIICQTLGVKSNPNNGTISLPFSTENQQEDPIEDDAQRLPITSAIAEQTATQSADAGPDQTSESDPESTVSDGGSDGGSDGDSDGLSDELKKAKSKLLGLWDKLRQGLDKVKGWVKDKFGAKKLSSPEKGT